MKIIDFESHYMPLEFKELASQRKEGEFPRYLKDEDIYIDGYKTGFAKVPYYLIYDKLTDIAENRIKDMDEYGVDCMVISATPNFERFDPEIAVDAARKVNDSMYEIGKKYPGRFKFFATLPVQDVEASCAELERCVKELGFVGWFTVSNYGDDALDDPRYKPLLQKAADLGVFIYLHPEIPRDERFHGLGTQLLMGGLGFQVDVQLTLFRMILSGTFDEIPNLKLMLGHFGEALPFTLDRSSARNKDKQWSKNLHLPAVNEHPVKYYFENNIWVTCSGNHCKAAFECTKEVIGIDRILVGTDYPFEKLENSIGFIRSLDMSEEEREKFYFRNAENAFDIYLD